MDDGAASPHDCSAWRDVGLGVAVVGWGAQQFAPLLLMYRDELGTTTTTIQAVFGMYVIGLVPGLLFGGPVSDRYGRRRVMVAALVASGVATQLLLLGGGGVGWLFFGRLVAGFASGAGFSAGAAWIKELSATGQPYGAARGPRRVTAAMAAGFGLGPLVAGALAQWAPLRTVLPYLPHLVLVIGAVPLVWRVRETRVADDTNNLLKYLRIPEVRTFRFRVVIAPLAPWVFGSVSIAVAYLPGVVASRLGGYTLIFSTVITLLCALSGLLVTPVAHRLAEAPSLRLLTVALTLVVAGVLIAAAAAATVEPLLVVLATCVLGAGYGCCQVYGLTEVQRLAAPERLAALTAAYQALSYLGFTVSFPLAAASRAVAPAALLCGVALLGAVTLLVIVFRATRSTSPGDAARATETSHSEPSPTLSSTRRGDSV